MREIKFRAFANDKMCYDVELSNDGWVHWWGEDGKECQAIGTIYDGGILKQCNLMQFTGLKDKNDKEIYEGDILRLLETLPTDDPAYPYYCDTMEVCYCEPHCRFGLTDGGAILDIPPNVEVIGNKFENPDLC